ncbi:Sulfate-binding protein [Gammaproteobacteria bacterium]
MKKINRIIMMFVLSGLGLLTLLDSFAKDPELKEPDGVVTRTITLGAYTTPREAYGKTIIPLFKKYWREKSGQEVVFEESYLGSGAQSRAIIGGFEADVAALSLEADVDAITKTGLITHDWKSGPNKGMVTRSIVVIATRQGNPKGIKDWDDLRQPGVEVLTPNVRTSGGAMWNICAMYGAALRGGTSAPQGDVKAAEALLSDVLKNVIVMDKGARESITNYEKGIGDVAITYENEVLVGRKAGQTYEYSVPKSTILIENPIALIDASVNKHGNREVVEEFIAFVQSPEAQRAFTRYGLRPVDEMVGKEVVDQFPRVHALFTINDLGGWPKVNQTLFGAQGAYERLYSQLGAGH